MYKSRRKPALAYAAPLGDSPLRRVSKGCGVGLRRYLTCNGNGVFPGVCRGAYLYPTAFFVRGLPEAPRISFVRGMLSAFAPEPAALRDGRNKGVFQLEGAGFAKSYTAAFRKTRMYPLSKWAGAKSKLVRADLLYGANPGKRVRNGCHRRNLGSFF